MGDKQTLLRETLERLLRRGANQRVKHLLEKTRSEDLAEVLALLSRSKRVQIFNLLSSPELQAEVLSEVEEELYCELLDPLSLEAVVTILSELASDDIADILAELDEERATAILERMKDVASNAVEDLMGYDPESAGGIMSPDVFALNRDASVADAITALHQQEEDVEMAFYVYVINEHEQLVGVVSLRQLVTSRPERLLSDIMEPDIITVEAHADQEEVARIVARYNFLALPVVDEANKLLGIVTVDDIIDVLYEEATEDILKLAGAGSELSPNAPLGDHLRMRYPWLVATSIGGFLAATTLGPFTATVGAFLVVFVPIVMGMAGNVGVQCSTIVVRGLATGSIDISQTRAVIRREMLIGVIMGLGYGAAIGAGAGLYSWATGHGDTPNEILYYALTVGLALAAAMTTAASLGTLVPLGLNRLGVDPAVATGPFVSTALDNLGILTFFAIAVLLKGLL